MNSIQNGRDWDSSEGSHKKRLRQLQKESKERRLRQDAEFERFDRQVLGILSLLILNDMGSKLMFRWLK